MSDDDTAATVTPSLTFTTTDWNIPQTVTVTGEQDTNARDHEVTLTHTASGGDYGGVTGEVTANVDDDETANDPPTFSDGDSTTRSVAENTDPGENVGTAVTATDTDTGDTLTYALCGTDARLFTIDTATGQLKTRAALNFEARASYAVTVSVHDGKDFDHQADPSIDDTTAVTITLTDENDPPDARSVQIRTPEDTAVEIAVSDVASDQDGNALTFTSVSIPGSGTATRNSGNTVITYMPNTSFEGRDTFTYEVSDGTLTATATVTVTVGAVLEERIDRVNETVVPEVTRAMAASTLGAVTGRIAAVTSGSAPAAGTVNLGGQSSLYQALKSNERALEDGTLDLTRLLGGTSFALSLNAAGDGGAGSMDALGDIGVWGSGDYRNLSGGDNNAVEWDGDVVSAHLGADARLRENLLAGLSISHSQGQFDYTDRSSGTAMDGTLKSRMTSLNPYVSLSSKAGLDLWATLGYGWGELEIDDDAAAPEKSDLSQWSAATGASGTLLSSDDWIAGGTTSLKLKAQISAARVEVEGNDAAINELTVDASHARLALEGGHAHALAAGGTLTPVVEFGLRQDGGDGETGTGIELGGLLRYQDPASGLTLEGHGRTLLGHSGNYEEWGIGGLIRLDPGADKRGISLSLTPTFGETQSGVQRLWNDGMPERATNDNAPQARLETQLGYGFGVFGGQGLLTTYRGFSLAGEAARRYSLGTRFEIGPSLNLSLEGERREAANDQAGHGVMLRGQIRF